MLKGLVVFGLTRRPIILLALLVFVAAGIAAFFKLNIEAYPNPAPVILEITAQAPGQSAEEMERYYTIPIEVGLAAIDRRTGKPADLRNDGETASTRGPHLRRRKQAARPLIQVAAKHGEPFANRRFVYHPASLGSADPRWNRPL